MRKVLIKIILLMMRTVSMGWSHLYSYSSSVKTRILWNKLHSFWIASEFYAYGEKTIIQFPLFLRGGMYISIGKQTTLNSNGVLTAWDRYREQKFSPIITIGDNTNIGEDFHITAINKISIGDGVLIGKKVTITDNSHGVTDETILTSPPIKRRLHSKGPVIIDDNVWIGDKVTILPNVRIGRNSIIGANSVVSQNIEENSIAIGIPARVIKVIK